MHTLGGAIMGASAAHAVASLFPTSGGVNPTFTLSALALRSVEYLLRSWSSLA
jgi:choline dehydrogenase-like flavoprotein